MGQTTDVQSFVMVFASQGEAGLFWDRVVSSEYNACVLDEAAEAVKDDDEFQLADARVGGLSFGRFASRTAAAQFVIVAENDGFEVEVYQDLIWMQEGPTLVGTGFRSAFSPPPTFLEEEIIGKIAARLS